jgi:hypothetical protein
MCEAARPDERRAARMMEGDGLMLSLLAPGQGGEQLERVIE